MAKDIYGVQVYVKDRKGRIGRGRAMSCRDADAARREAERCARGRGAIGASAFWLRVYEEEFAEGDDPVTLAVFGTVPPGVADSLPF